MDTTLEKVFCHDSLNMFCSSYPFSRGEEGRGGGGRGKGNYLLKQERNGGGRRGRAEVSTQSFDPGYPSRELFLWADFSFLRECLEKRPVFKLLSFSEVL